MCPGGMREPVGQGYISLYKLYRKDRKGFTGGSIILYIKKGIESSKLEILKGVDSSTELL